MLVINDCSLVTDQIWHKISFVLGLFEREMRQKRTPPVQYYIIPDLCLFWSVPLEFFFGDVEVAKLKVLQFLSLSLILLCYSG